MPYEWIKSQQPETRELHLWPHQSLKPKGFVWFMGITFALISVPLYPLIGTVVFWGLLPFMALAGGAMWLALTRSRLDAQILEILTLDQTHAHLRRHGPRGAVQEWDCNRYWAAANLHKTGGPVPNYVTLKGGGREVEIGAFLSEDERKTLYDQLKKALNNPR